MGFPAHQPGACCRECWVTVAAATDWFFVPGISKAASRSPVTRLEFTGSSGRGPSQALGCAPQGQSSDDDAQEQYQYQTADRDESLHERPRADRLADSEAEVLLDQPEPGVVDVAEEQRS